VEIRGVNVPSTKSIAVTMSVTAPSTCSGTTGTWKADAKQANQFNGQPGNSIALNTAGSSLSTAVSASTTGTNVAFTAQPHNVIFSQGASASQAISDTNYTPPPTGGPVKVSVTDDCGHPIAGASVAVTLGNSRGATLGGTPSATTNTGGVASFGNLTVSLPNDLYRLNASSGSASATSSQFSADHTAKFCDQNDATTGPCAQTVNSPSNNTATVTANYQSGSNSGYLAESVNAGTALDCSPAIYGGYASVSPDTWTFSMVPSTNRSEVWTETLRNPVIPLQGTINAILNNPQVCYGSIHQFPVPRGGLGGLAAPGTLPDGAAGFIGVLPDCPSSGPCIDRANVKKVLDLSSPLGFDITVPVNIPPGQGDPARH
jgi:hypothetical protein